MEPSVKSGQFDDSPCGMAHSPEDQIPMPHTEVIAEVTNQLKSKLRCGAGGPPNPSAVNGCCTNAVLPSVSSNKSNDCSGVNGLAHCGNNSYHHHPHHYTCSDPPPHCWSCSESSYKEGCDIACLGECVPAALQQPADCHKRPTSSSSSSDADLRSEPSTDDRTTECSLHQEKQGVSNISSEPEPENCSEVKRSTADESASGSSSVQGAEKADESGIRYIAYESEHQMPDIMRLIQKDLSEPYSIYTYRYFIHNWPKLCFLAMDGEKCVGAIVCKLDMHKKMVKRGYIAMLAVDEKYRKRKIGSNLVLKAIHAMIQDDADEVVLETEVTNKPALRLYENLGFVRDKRLFRYYLNGVDALRLKLWLR